MSAFSDPWQEGLARGWQHIDASRLSEDRVLEADVCVIGTGAGGGMAADVLSAAGLKVVMIEEGMLRTSRDFRMLEAEAYPELYQESAARKTLDKAIGILQGRTVGGSTTVNWTSSFRTPPATLAFWRERFGLAELTEAAMRPWFEQAEARLNIIDSPFPPNANNLALERGGQKLGILMERIRRNVRGCYNLGYCGLGCPTNAKQSMLVTTIPAALARGAALVSRARAERLVFWGEYAQSLECRALRGTGYETGTAKIASPEFRVGRFGVFWLASGVKGGRSPAQRTLDAGWQPLRWLSWPMRHTGALAMTNRSDCHA